MADSKNLESLNYDPVIDIIQLLSGQEEVPDFSFKELINATKIYKNHINEQLVDLETLKSQNCEKKEGYNTNELKTKFKVLSEDLAEFHKSNFITMNHIKDLQKTKENLVNSIGYYDVLSYVNSEHLKIIDLMKNEDYISIKKEFDEYSRCLDLLVNKYADITDQRQINKYYEIYDNLELRVKKYIKQLFQEKDSVEIERTQF